MAWKIDKIEPNGINEGKKTFLVDAQADLANIPDAKAGDVAYTAELTIWVMAIDGTWKAV